MTLKEQFDFIQLFYWDALDVIHNRQSDYAPAGVALLNVLDSCVRWKQTPFQVLGNLLDKQTTALQHLCMHGHVNSDPPRSRLIDAANYFALFAMYITHQKEIHNAWRVHWTLQPCTHAHPGLESEWARREAEGTLNECRRCDTLTWLDNANCA